MKILLRFQFFDCCLTGSESQIVSLDGTEVGRISKDWSGLDVDYFGLSFPMNLDVRIKAILLGASMLIVIKFYLIKFSFFAN